MSTMLAVQWVDEYRQKLIELADEIWNYAEVGLREFRSAQALISELEKAGFVVDRGVAGMPSAFVATYGSGKPVIGFLGEYDALPGLSQKVTATRDPVEPDAPGHGCGHNLLGVGALGGVLALKNAMESTGVPGTIRYFGCPAEETLVGKVFMTRDGIFNGLDAALTWHPLTVNGPWLLSSTALNSVKFNFHGVAAHAAANPDMGRSALDAVQLMDMGVNYLREHIIQEARIHCVITKGGGEPNIVPAEAQVWYYVRAPKRKQVESIYARVVDCAKGAALMTGTTFDIEFVVGCYNYMPNRALTRVIVEAMTKVGGPKFMPKDWELARQLEDGFAPGQKEAVGAAFGVPEHLNSLTLHEDVEHSIGEGEVMAGSTDVGDVSWVVPTAQFMTCCAPVGTAAHSWQMAAASGSGIGHKGALTAAKVFALAGYELFAKPEVLQEARLEFEKMIDKEGAYTSPIPADLEPPLDLLQH